MSRVCKKCQHLMEESDHTCPTDTYTAVRDAIIADYAETDEVRSGEESGREVVLSKTTLKMVVMTQHAADRTAHVKRELLARTGHDVRDEHTYGAYDGFVFYVLALHEEEFTRNARSLEGVVAVLSFGRLVTGST